MHQQIDALFASRETYLTEVIGKSKDLTESCCKTIFKESDEPYDKNWGLGQLIKATMKCLGIDSNEINAGLPAGDAIKRTRVGGADK